MIIRGHPMQAIKFYEDKFSRDRQAAGNFAGNAVMLS